MDGSAPQARGAALSGAAAALDAEIARAAIDGYLTLILRACCHGGQCALHELCRVLEAPRTAIDEAPALALVAALADDAGAADRALRAAAWTMAAQRVAAAWPWEYHQVFEVVRAAMPVNGVDFEHLRTLGALTACATTTDDPDTRDGQRMQFSRESLEHVIGAATGRRPVRRDMLEVIAPWTVGFMQGIKVCDARLRELEREHAQVVPARAPPRNHPST